MACPALVPEAGFVRSMMAFVDCQAATLGAGGYQALATPGSALSLVLTAFMTLFIALLGYRLLLGYGPDLRSGMFSFAKIAIVLALATSWPAYRTLVYDVALLGPAELAGEIGAPSGLPGSDGGLIQRLDVADRAMVALSILGEGRPPVQTDANQVAAATQTVPQPYPGFNTLAIGGSRMLFLVGAIGGLAAVRMVAGLLLAVGPLFVAFLLFENTRSLFEGWIRVLAGAALAAFGTAVALGAELALIEPWLTDLIGRRTADEWLPEMPVELLVVTIVFAFVIVAMLYGAARIAWGFRLAPVWRAAPARIVEMLQGHDALPLAASGAAAAAPAEGRSRAATVVDAVAATQRREAGNAPVAAFTPGRGDPAGPGGRPQAHAGRPHDSSETLGPVPLGQSFPRRTRGRVSASAGRRDRRT
ncbi:MAG TPA: type IV secretion system protein [Allosphingosinicella sp.]|nr:type IV secretion system protein [Allosphingosinicella sp.]